MTKFTGRGQLVERLVHQLGGEAHRARAIAILQQRGYMMPDGVTLTEAGEKRNQMTAEERALDRASKETGKPTSAFAYDPHSNRCHLRGAFKPRRGYRHGA